MPEYFFDGSTDIKLIILFVTTNFKRPVSISDITDIAISHGYADYFSMTQNLSELEVNGLITSANEAGKYILTSKGHDALQIFSDELPFTVREKLLNSIIQAKRKENESSSIIAEYKKGDDFKYTLFCEIIELGTPVYSMSVVLPTEESARIAANRFKARASEIYSQLIKTLTDEK
ncbi:MAG: DUF4364 family protein [Bacillota bacterium]|nr:DUF4364 family protein [Bacillota bacterium]